MSAIGHHPTDTTSLSVDMVIERAVAVGVGVLVAIGFVASYDTLRVLAVTDGGFAPWLAPAVPLSFDLGIVVLSLKVVAAARQGRRAITLRTLVIGLSASTVIVNSSASTSTPGRLLHAVPPAMFIVCFESLVTGARRTALSKSPPDRRPPGWLLAPVATIRQWRSASLHPTHGVTTQAGGPTARPPRRRGTQPGSTPGRVGPVPTAMSTERLDCARAALTEDADMSATRLAEHLRANGHSLSIRTAQRLKAQARQH